MSKKCACCSTRWNVRTLMNLHGHIEFDTHNSMIGESIYITIED